MEIVSRSHLSSRINCKDNRCSLWKPEMFPLQSQMSLMHEFWCASKMWFGIINGNPSQALIDPCSLISKKGWIKRSVSHLLMSIGFATCLITEAVQTWKNHLIIHLSEAFDHPLSIALQKMNEIDSIKFWRSSRGICTLDVAYVHVHAWNY